MYCNMKYSLSSETQLGWLAIMAIVTATRVLPVLAQYSPENPQTPIDSACSAGAAPVEDAFLSLGLAN